MVDAIEITEAVDSQDLPRAVQDAVVVEECPACGKDVPARVIGKVRFGYGDYSPPLHDCSLCGDASRDLLCEECTELDMLFRKLLQKNKGAAAIWLLQKVSGR